MRNILTAALAVLSIGLFSCQKEVDDIFAGNGSGGGNGSKLVRIGSRIGSDSLTTDFIYNSSNLLKTISYSGTVVGQSVTAQISIIRNASNIITSTITKSNIYATIGIDSIAANYNYDAVNSRYKYSVASYTEFGVSTHDSVMYGYAPDGKLVSSIGYHDDGTGSGYEPDTKDSVFYNGSNISSVKSYSYNGSGFDLDEVTNYEQYDNKINPLHFTTDAPVLGMTTFYPSNNVTKRTIIDYVSGSSATGTFTYSYNNSNRPAKVVSTDGTQTSTDTYYYQ